jgi:Heavy-metal-associated domain
LASLPFRGSPPCFIDYAYKPSFPLECFGRTLDVKNMTCSVCPITVKKALEKVASVTMAKVDFEKKTVAVTFDPEKASPPH